MKRTEILRAEDEHDRFEVDGALIFDGDGDGTSAATIYSMVKPGRYFAITNKQKSDRALVSRVAEIMPLSAFSLGRNDEGDTHGVQLHRGFRYGVFDVSAEDNHGAMREIIDAGGLVDFVDHHTRDHGLIPSGVNRYVQEDVRSNCTATIAYEMAEAAGILEDGGARIKATQLAIVGLANDAKATASREFGGDLINGEDRGRLIKLGQAVNFGSGAGMMDSVELLRGLVGSRVPLDYLAEFDERYGLIGKRDEAIRDVGERAELREDGRLAFYVLPHGNAVDELASRAAYGELLNGKMAEDPAGFYMAAFLNDSGGWNVAGRNGGERAREMMDHMARDYGRDESEGRTTAAGFRSARETNPEELWASAKRAYHEVQ